MKTTLPITATEAARNLFNEIEEARVTYLRNGRTLREIQKATHQWIEGAQERSEITLEDAAVLRAVYSL
jgi:hypothetical protein